MREFYVAELARPATLNRHACAHSVMCHVRVCLFETRGLTRPCVNVRALSVWCVCDSVCALRSRDGANGCSLRLI